MNYSSLLKLSALGLLLASVSPSYAAEPIEGLWRTQSGETAKIAPCAAGFCITVLTGPNKGKEIGQMAGSGTSYKGSVLKPDENKTYKGKADINGNTLALSGCVMGGLICKTQDWTRK